jgi:hypothetical protein
MSGSLTVWLPATWTLTGWFGLAGRTRGKKRSTSARYDHVAFDPLDPPVAPPLLQQGAVPALVSRTAIVPRSLPSNFAPWSTDGSGAPLEEMVCQ